ncbi:MAG: polymerase III, gamma and tau subunit protein [Candidatus Gottesmanbacteria bacterium GW2011_GWA1_43_11]|uniref:DNA polymerase III subunit gamma/tau n=1 Tax=Candidatus Gottesmanbacteria bacterium GW2011_GWA1_43_11 TaxID=1618436 RepID=A0A0G1FAY8_9BACT|nr:MAG: polymerase III, gamma and tau subunit protein [Candidatus Gottesmanbacteria bacterium GW2011_GWA1_43_11]
MVFYRKYRPKVLSELDNREVAELLTRYLHKAAIPHAFLFVGPKGTGKTSLARILAKSINCPNTKNQKACGMCETCESIAAGNNLDVLEIDAASNRGIEEIRQLRETIKLSPIQLKFKVYIIDEVHMLTSEAFNALLKTIEEPPAHAVFVLATTEAHKVPETVFSRCVFIPFERATVAQLKESLLRIVKGEKLQIDDAALTLIAEAADGAFRDGAKLLEQVATSADAITVNTVQSSLGLTSGKELEKFVILLQEKKTAQLLQQIHELVSSGKNLTQFMITIVKRLETLLVESFSTKSSWSKVELIAAIRSLTHAFPLVKSSPIPELPFELALVEYCEAGIVPVTTSRAKPHVPSVQEMGAIATISAGDADSSVQSILAHWSEILEKLKPFNHSIVGVLRSCRPVKFADGMLTIEAGYKFHAERITEAKVRDLVAKVIGEVVGLDVKIETVLKQRTVNSKQ